MRITLRVIALHILLLIIFKASSSAACTCVRSSLSAAEVRGRVVATYKQRPEEPIPSATVKLLRCNGGDCQTIAEVTTDESGRFYIGGIKSGDYDIVASATYFERVWVKLKVSGRPGGTKKEIVFGLEPGFDCCAGWAKVQKMK